MDTELYESIAVDHGRSAMQLRAADEKTGVFVGGQPTVGEGLEWPMKNGRPLGFLGQVSLHELPPSSLNHWLPSTGALLFFYDFFDLPLGNEPVDAGGWSVMYVPEGECEGPLVAPEEPIFSKHFKGESFVSIPSVDRFEPGAEDPFEGSYELYDELIESAYEDEAMHQIGGYPIPEGDDKMEFECQLYSEGIFGSGAYEEEDPEVEQALEATNDWKLLFQFHAEDEDDFPFLGKMYFWIREADARELIFDKVWMLRQEV